MRTTQSNLGKAGFLVAILISTGAANAAEQIAEARSEHVSMLRDKGVNEGHGLYGLEMPQLVGYGLVSEDSRNGEWRDPNTASWTGEHGIKSYEDFLANTDAQRETFARYIDDMSVYLRFNKPEIKVGFDGQVLELKDVLQLASHAKPYEIVDFVVSGKTDSLDAAAQRAGLETGAELVRMSLARAEMDTPSLPSNA